MSLWCPFLTSYEYTHITTHYSNVGVMNMIQQPNYAQSIWIMRFMVSVLLLLLLLLLLYLSLFFICLFFRQKANKPMPKHSRQLTTWQVLYQVERRFHIQELNRKPLPWDLDISPPSSSSLGSSRTHFLISYKYTHNHTLLKCRCPMNMFQQPNYAHAIWIRSLRVNEAARVARRFGRRSTARFLRQASNNLQ
jgi:hypothetical protein